MRKIHERHKYLYSIIYDPRIDHHCQVTWSVSWKIAPIRLKPFEDSIGESLMKRDLCSRVGLRHKSHCNLGRVDRQTGLSHLLIWIEVERICLEMGHFEWHEANESPMWFNRHVRVTSPHPVWSRKRIVKRTCGFVYLSVYLVIGASRSTGFFISTPRAGAHCSSLYPGVTFTRTLPLRTHTNKEKSELYIKTLLLLLLLFPICYIRFVWMLA